MQTNGKPIDSGNFLLTQLEKHLDNAPFAIKKVVLYKHGVGYFERRGAILFWRLLKSVGQVDGHQAVDLYFKEGEMNDVLKSLSLVDGGGGYIASVSYESRR